MENLEYIKYTYKHRKIVIRLAEIYFVNNDEVLEQVKYHDLDKLFLYLFYDKKTVSRIHRDVTNHHQNELEKTKLDYIEMVLDWESARYTKPDKPLNAYDTLVAYYPELSNQILPILEELGIDSPNLPMDESILEYVKEIDTVTIEDIRNELISQINLLTDIKKLELK